MDEPYRNIPTEQLKHQLLKEKAEKVGGLGGGRSPQRVLWALHGCLGHPFGTAAR